ncbi:MAG TPA: SAM-dependent chlorinase/fluorinase [Stellaceae bacterium]|nr:SAM-dependent chlorinase/fluorinase [Stellaceae bacterium]
MIVLFTDFGAGPYVGQMKAVLAARAPGVTVIDLFADAPQRDPRRAAYLLAAYAPWFEAGTVFLAVVDPGVGGARAPIIVEADGRRFVGPDNGLMAIVLRRAAAPSVREIAWRPEALSPSFHGRDLFAPVAAMLARGDAVAATPRALESALRPDWPDDLAEIVYVDAYGNAMTGLRAATVPPAARLRAATHRVPPARTFSDVPAGAAFWYENSCGLVEIAVNLGRADAALGLAVGSAITVEN